jgi:acyl dehydratase
MTPEERDIVERFRRAMDREYVLEEVAPPDRAEDFRRNQVVRGYDENVTSLGIKRWAVVNDDLNPLWFDDEYARRTRWQGPVAPPLFILAINDGVMPAAWLSAFLYDRNWVINTKEYPNFVGGLQGNTEIDFFEPVRPGDVIRTRSKCTDCFWKQGRTYRLFFTAGETSYTNQKGQLVAVCRQGAVYRFK